ncbi:MAG TPA: hypothetical protein VFR67_00815 [Pilimelia sp.]|nr:hypothetical protein [Pilimelia sp.]
MTEPPLATIDDLLGHEEEPPPAQRRPPGTVAWLVKAVLAAAALAGLIVLGLRALDVGLAYWLAFVGVFGLLALRRAVVLVAPPPALRARARGTGEESGEYRWGTGDGLRRAVSRWERRLEDGSTDLQRFGRIAQPALAEIVDERLRQRHGLTRASDPARARALVGEQLWAILAAPVRRPMTPKQFEVLVTRLERIGSATASEHRSERQRARSGASAEPNTRGIGSATASEHRSE